MGGPHTDKTILWFPQVFPCWFALTHVQPEVDMIISHYVNQYVVCRPK